MWTEDLVRIGLLMESRELTRSALLASKTAAAYRSLRFAMPMKRRTEQTRNGLPLTLIHLIHPAAQ